MVGELWLKILEAKNLKAVDKSGTSDPYVVVSVPAIRKTIEGKVVKKNLNPKWNEEFVVPITSSSDSIIITIMDWNRFASNEKLGSVELPVESLTPGVLFDKWMPLSQGEVHVLAFFTPKQLLPKSPALRLPTFRLLLEKNTYFRGETVRGVIVFNVHQPREIRGVRIKFHGSSFVKFEGTERYGNKTRTVIYRSRITYFDVIATAFGKPRGVDEKIIIEPGNYIWPFEFHLPERVAPSWEGEYGRNRYEITAYVDIPWAKDKECSQVLNISVHYPSIIDEFKAARTKERVLGSLAVVYEPTIPDIVYPGDIVNIPLTIKNLSDRPIKEVKIKLYAQGHFHACYKERSTWDTVASIKFPEEALPIQPKSTWQGEVQLSVPFDVAPSVPPIVSRILQLKHKLCIKAKSDGNALTRKEMKTFFPILIGLRPPADYTPPFVIEESDKTVNFAQVDERMKTKLLAVPASVVTSGNKNFFVTQQPLPSELFSNSYAPEQWQETPADQETQEEEVEGNDTEQPTATPDQ